VKDEGGSDRGSSSSSSDTNLAHSSNQVVFVFFLSFIYCLSFFDVAKLKIFAKFNEL